jgi:DNA-binding transcriptional ArsR family regulator
MNSAEREPREMTDEEATGWMKELVDKLTTEKGAASGACCLEATKNPVRRKILDALEEKPLAIDEISDRVGVGGSALRFHLNFLKASCFVQIEGDTVDLTPGGVSVVRSRKRT